MLLGIFLSQCEAQQRVTSRGTPVRPNEAVPNRDVSISNHKIAEVETARGNGGGAAFPLSARP